MKTQRTFLSVALATVTLLALPLVASATPPPDANTGVLVCGGAYYVDLNLDFAEAGVDVSVVATADLSPTGFGPAPHDPPRWYSAYVVAAHRDTAHPAWDSHSDTTSGNGGFPSQPAYTSYRMWIDAGCELKGTATVNVGCPGGSSESKTLTRTWVGCGF